MGGAICNANPDSAGPPVIFRETAIEGVWRVLPEPRHDLRGSFVRTFCADEFAVHGLPHLFEQSSISHNIKAGTLRGMHFQPHPYAEAKFVRCVRGAIFDVALDLRVGSRTRGRWIGEELSADNCIGLYIAPGLAHGFQTLADRTDVLYQITPSFKQGLSDGIRWDDPAFKIDWPIAEPILSERDANYADWCL
ncbi:dTDP-4-dehydrorhamnose 3,5-epimerase family protein [Methylorubrum aminovorans]|uniref:dTDP-4-dehydrorhamnose 3,5-epimerase family protein n=1 Tax=Methylorubrum aminovorans TaxID=269069 RepID=UPI0027E48495|nr:dTDP-4-dehydrorhamnose 3,5-epimerase family protein [Methylorubrum aminovorans]